MYADYDYYTGTYGGTLIQADAWPAAARDAGLVIDALTFGRLRRGGVPDDDIRMGLCAAAEEMYRQQQAAGSGADPPAGVAAEKEGNRSVTYESAAAREQALKKRVQDAAKQYILPSHPLRYRGRWEP